MCQPIPTKNVYELQALCNEAVITEQHEATIAAALALPEAERYRLWRLLDEQFSPHAERNVKELDERRMMFERFERATANNNATTQKSVVHGIRKNFLIDLAKEWEVVKE